MDPLYGMTDDISIHALHEESDAVKSSGVLESGYFNPRSP